MKRFFYYVKISTDLVDMKKVYVEIYLWRNKSKKSRYKVRIEITTKNAKDCIFE